MLGGMRAASQGWIGRVVMALIMGVIVFSFAIWGIGDIFSGFNGNVLAKVGGTEVTVDAYRTSYQNELQRLQGQARRAITNEEARRVGLDRQVLGRLITEAVFDSKARQLGLAISDADIAKAILADDTFKGPTGRFDRTRFESLLRDNGMTERSYIAAQRGVDLRQQISEAVIGDLKVPKPMLDAIHRYQAETRSVDYVVLPPAVAGEIPPPTGDVLQKFYDDRKAAFRTPEYRALVTLAVTPATLAKPDAVSDADAQKRYDELKTERYQTPERRSVDQIVFPDEASAAAAKSKLDGGETFEALLAERNLTPQAVTLGTVARDGLNDAAVREAAFALPDGGTSGPVKAAFGTVLVHVSQIVPAATKPFAEVAMQLKAEIATARAKRDIDGLHDKIEDARSSGKTLADAAKGVGLEARTIEAIDANGRDKAGAPVTGLVDTTALVKAAFASDVGVDNETLTTADGGYEWYEVTRIDPARQQTFDEVKARIETAWRDDETATRLAAKAADLVKMLGAGKSVSDIAAAEGNLEVKHVGDVKRGGGGDLPQAVVAQIFNVPPDGSGSVADGSNRILFHILDSIVPPVDYEAPDLVKLGDDVKNALMDDVLAQYVGQVRTEVGVSINPQGLQSALGGAE